jgi:hypothetical protein
MNDLVQDNNDNPAESRQFNSHLIERAITDAQNLVIYTSRAGIKVEEKIFNTLVTARTKWDEDQWSEKFALEFWEAFRQTNEIIKPATVDSVRAICIEPSHSGLRGFFQNQYGRSEAARAITRYTIWTLFILAIVLFVQIYWVIGNSLSIKITELLDSEDELTNSIQKARLDHSELEVLFKLKEEESGNLQEAGTYEFYDTSDWERETLQLKTELARLEYDLEALKIQLERNFGILTVWAFAWDQSISDPDIQNVVIKDQIANLDLQIDKEEEDSDETSLRNDIREKEEEFERLDTELKELETQLAELVSLAQGQESQDAGQQAIRDEITETNSKMLATSNWLEQNNLETIKNEKENNLQKLNAERVALEQEQTRWKAKEETRRLRLSADFMLVILQVYLLPILYGLLGASVFVLRKIMRGISNATYFPDRSYLLRLALGTLSGLIIGWFIFLLPGQSIVSAISPMAFAFLVGYNIEIVFSLMDKVIDNFTKDSGADEQSPANRNQMNGNGQADPQPPANEGEQALPQSPGPT